MPSRLPRDAPNQNLQFASTINPLTAGRASQLLAFHLCALAPSLTTRFISSRPQLLTPILNQLDITPGMAFISPLPFTSRRPNQLHSCRRRPQISTRVSVAPRMLVLEAESIDDMDKILKAAEDTLVVIDYSTSWCGPCKAFAPIYEEMSEKYKDIVFVKVMGDKTAESSELMKREGIRAVPAFHFWKKETKLKDFTGARSEDLENAIQSLK